MNEQALRQLAAQLRLPEGEAGIAVANRMNVNNELMNRWAIDQLAVQPGDQVLEVGPGNGRFVPDLLGSDPSVRYVGYDHSALMVSEAVAHNRALVDTGRVQFIWRSGPVMPFPNHSFTKALAVNVIYFWEDPAAELAELHRVLAPGGRLLLVIRPRSVMVRLPFVQHGFQLFEPADVADLLAANRFRVTETRVLAEPAQHVGGEAVSLSTALISSEPV
ncbi:class I SAM-dependent methyltransferase [Spirosoma sp. 209]|uniref:class I SAM-dependent methyltransferase n=1 Tax=Spirosoma sp. 209 TaxID=1955701 RepID=UPI00098D377F|nr:methyltransferase domain-containing protein [Spirosoma sp. 209]